MNIDPLNNRSFYAACMDILLRRISVCWIKKFTLGKLFSFFFYTALIPVSGLAAWILSLQYLLSSIISDVILYSSKSSFTQFKHLFFGLPRLLLPCIPSSVILLIGSSFLLITCPCNLSLASLTFSAMLATPHQQKLTPKIL